MIYVICSCVKNHWSVSHRERTELPIIMAGKQNSTRYKSLKVYKEPYDASLWTYNIQTRHVPASTVIDRQKHTFTQINQLL